MACKNCEERRRLIQEAITARRAGDIVTMKAKLREAGVSFTEDVWGFIKPTMPKLTLHKHLRGYLRGPH